MKNIIKKSVAHIIKAYSDFKEESAYNVINDETFLQGSKAILRYNKNDFKIQVLSSSFPNSNALKNPFEHLNGQIKLQRNNQKVVAYVEDIKSLTQTFTDPFITTYFTKSLTVDENELLNKLKHTALIKIDEMPDFSIFPSKAVKIGSTTHSRYFDITINKNIGSTTNLMEI